MSVEAYNVIRQALTRPEVSFKGKYYGFENVPVEIKPAQLPHPPFWYAVPTPEGAVWPAENGINVVCGGPAPKNSRDHRSLSRHMGGVRERAGRHPVAGVQSFRGGRRHRSAGDGTGTPCLAAVLREFHEALEKARHAAALRKIPEDFDTMVENGGAIAGSPGTIRAHVRGMAEAAGANYFIAQFSFGDLSHQEVLRSAAIFAREVLPANARAHAVGPVSP